MVLSSTKLSSKETDLYKMIYFYERNVESMTISCKVDYTIIVLSIIIIRTVTCEMPEYGKELLRVTSHGLSLLLSLELTAGFTF